MDFQVIRDRYYKSLIEKIDEYFPSFMSVFDKDDGIYPILGELGTFIMENFKQEKIKIQVAGFINEVIEQGGSETEDAIVLQLFQKFYENNNLSHQISKLLNPPAKSIFDIYFEEYMEEGI